MDDAGPEVHIPVVVERRRAVRMRSEGGAGTHGGLKG